MSPSRRESSSSVTAALARSRLGVWPLVWIVMAAAAPLTVVAGGATAGFAVTGITGIPLGYVVVALILAVFSIGYVAMSRKVVNAGAFYTYITHGLGKPAGVAGSFVAVVGYNLMQTGLYGGFGVAAHDFATAHLGTSAPWWMWAMLAWALIAFLGGRRIDLNGRVLAVLLIAEIAVAIVLAIVQVSHPAGGNTSFTTLSPGNLFTAGLGAALATAIAGFVGFEGTAVFSEESKDPQKTVARATYLALAIIGVLYAFCAWTMSVATGPDQIVARATSDGSQLIFNLSSPYVPAALITLGQLLFVTSLFAALLAFHNTAARYFYALGREGVLPSALGKTSPKTRAPIYGSLLQTAIALIVIATYMLAGWDPFTRMFFWLTVLGGVAVLILMCATSVSVLVYFFHPRHRDGVGTARGILAPALATVALGAVLSVTLVQMPILLGVGATSPVRWQLPGVFAVAAVLGAVWALVLKARRPDVYAVIGLGANSAVTEPASPLVTAGR
ncbi:amino acid/polyamine/organocation transporter (APC superfamily) [Pseudosporangium ferrugineum]|uniref:Amino acid/polyamine/organocation transporter (APC superfamily) n=1 Tax=Pseudosporangium ferrugineum TaxID=439699 RepID=A0A2T0RS70_9ACTN|nr:amino acid/polyamine/organocation transporter (APC superfamily) [Pseudosporangium ferrugineum]